MPIEVAIYGKGGIGKSTVSANLSYALSTDGKTVVQIGCDPKHDSTRQLLKGQRLLTVLDMVRTTDIRDRSLEKVMQTGSGGVRCIEAGGPEPGIGCAGKGILSMFQTLEKLGLEELRNDVILYDVLGDVVCGGFAVPMRPDYSDVVFVVTSGEFMSLYAANNILKGTVRFEDGHPRIGGIIFNSRGSEKENAKVEEFSEAVKIPIVARIPRSVEFEKAESEMVTVCEMSPDSDISRVFRGLSDLVSAIERGEERLYYPEPLTDDQLDALAAGEPLVTGEYRKTLNIPKPVYPKCHVFTPVKRIGMGPIGAAITAGKVTDVPVVIHGSRSCGYSMLNELYEERLAHLRNNPDMECGSGDNVFCSGICTAETIFGGTDSLETLLEKLAADNRFIIVITTCLTSMIGDNCGDVVKKVGSRHPGIRIALINGNGAAEGVDAHMEVIKALAETIDTTLRSDGRTVRIIDDNFIAVDRGDNEDILRRMMSPFGKTVGTGFIRDCTLQDVVNLRTTELCIMAENSPDNLALAGILRGKGVKVGMRTLPRGFREGCEWVAHIGKMFSNQAASVWLVNSMRAQYDAALERARPILEGKAVGIIYDGSEPTYWMEEALADAGVNVTVYSMGGEVSESHAAEIRAHPNHAELTEDLQNNSPDLVIGSRSACRGLAGLICEDYPYTTLAHEGSIRFLERVCHILESNPEEGWKTWGGMQ